MLLAASGAAAWVTFANVDWLLGLVGREGSNTATLTGRTTIWDSTLQLIPDHPWIGHGFGTFYSPLTRDFFSSGYIAPHAHNTWLNALFETGAVGTALLSLFLLAGLLWGGGAHRTNIYAWPLALFVTLCGLTGVVFGGKLSTLWVIVAAMLAQSAWERHMGVTAAAGPQGTSATRTRGTRQARR